MPKLEGTPMQVLVEGDRLERVDIMLSRSKGSLLGWLIRLGTGSYWNHAFMIYVIRSAEQGYNTTFIIESGGSGIDIHNIAHYFERPKKYDVGIKRLETDWFQSDKLQYGRKIRGFSLQEIDDKYDHKLILSIARRILRQIILAVLYPWQRLKKDPARRRVHVPRVIGMNINAYICSGFVQWAYYQGIGRLSREKSLDQAQLQDIIFNPRLTGQVTEDKLLSTTPADLANSRKLTWKYVIKNGVVWEASDEEEVGKILRSKR